MGKILAATGRAALYFLIYPAVQIAVSTIAFAIVSAQIAAEAMAAGEAADTAASYNQTLERLSGYSPAMLLISGITTLFLYWLILLVQGRSFSSEIALRKIAQNGILPVLFLGAAFELLFSLSLQTIPYPGHWTDAYLQHASHLMYGTPFLPWITVVFITPAVEETVFRGFIYSRLKNGMPAPAAALFTSLLFAAMHGTLLQGIYMFFLGLLFIWVLERFRSLYASVLFHVSFNLTGMLLPLLPAVADDTLSRMFPAAAALCAAAVFWAGKSSPER